MKIHNKALKISVFILFLLLGFISCSRHVYYVYDEDGTREGYLAGYCSFEVKGNKNIIYRVYSEVYANPNATPYSPQYIFIKGDNHGVLNAERLIVLDAQEMYTKYIYKENFPDIRSNVDNSISIILPTVFENYDALIYQISEKKDSLIISNNRGFGFSSYGSIKWFPPYAKKQNN